MQKAFHITHVSVRITGGPKIKIPVNYIMVVGVKWWKERQQVDFISTTAPEDEFSFEGDHFLLGTTSGNEFITLSIPFGELEMGGSFGGMEFFTDTPVPAEFCNQLSHP